MVESIARLESELTAAKITTEGDTPDSGDHKLSEELQKRIQDLEQQLESKFTAPVGTLDISGQMPNYIEPNLISFSNSQHRRTSFQTIRSKLLFSLSKRFRGPVEPMHCPCLW